MPRFNGENICITGCYLLPSEANVPLRIPPQLTDGPPPIMPFVGLSHVASERGMRFTLFFSTEGSSWQHRSKSKQILHIPGILISSLHHFCLRRLQSAPPLPSSPPPPIYHPVISLERGELIKAEVMPQ
ncbi:hypothetical protein DNTS_017164 [Danionella cerebrum]|uniref:Uncharacterized protein n=1 Tax=Danionella cerebrum TaxID=2873325 RepID=A0A553NGC6_9TELE|nr:hypothetical protein DNTS_017164 [Danionella translucida]